MWRATRLGPNAFAVPVALKTLNEAHATTPEHVRNFLREARAASSVQHRNVIQARDLVFEKNRYWLSMDLIQGWSMRELLSAVEASRQPMPVPVALSLARDAIRGVQAIHDAGLIHRNISPDNLMIDSTGQVVVLDFGAAIWQHSQRIRFTPPVEVFDPIYASPDLRARLPVDGRTDVYSLGALLDQLIPRGGDVPMALEAIIRRAADPDAESRFPTAQALEIALDLLALRETWLVPQSYVAAYVNDLLRPATSGLARTPAGSLARGTDTNPAPVDRPAEPSPERPAERPSTPGTVTVLPRGRRGMIGVGAIMPRLNPVSPVSPEDDSSPRPVPREPPRDGKRAAEHPKPRRSLAATFERYRR